MDIEVGSYHPLVTEYRVSVHVQFVQRSASRLPATYVIQHAQNRSLGKVSFELRFAKNAWDHKDIERIYETDEASLSSFPMYPLSPFQVTTISSLVYLELDVV